MTCNPKSVTNIALSACASALITGAAFWLVFGSKTVKRDDGLTERMDEQVSEKIHTEAPYVAEQKVINAFMARTDRTLSKIEIDMANQREQSARIDEKLDMLLQRGEP